jgi:hypothetical protein
VRGSTLRTPRSFFFILRYTGESVKRLLVLVLLVTGCFAHRSEGALRDRIAVLSVDVARADTVRIRDSVVVVRTITATDSLRDTLLLHITDTVKVKQFITRVDTLKVACQRCVESSARLSALNDSLNRANAKLVTRVDRRSLGTLLWLLGAAAVFGAIALVVRLR